MGGMQGQGMGGASAVQRPRPQMDPAQTAQRQALMQAMQAKQQTGQGPNTPPTGTGAKPPPPAPQPGQMQNMIGARQGGGMPGGKPQGQPGAKPPAPTGGFSSPARAALAGGGAGPAGKPGKGAAPAGGNVMQGLAPGGQ